MDSQQRSLRILHAAARLIAHYGFDKTTMEEIAREAGVSKGALYLVWSSKDALFDALLAHEMRWLMEDLEARLRADPQGWTLAGLYRHTLLALLNNPLVAALYTRDSRILGDYIRRQDTQRYTQRLLLSGEGIRQMQFAGLLRDDIRPDVMAYVFSIIALGTLSIGGLVPGAPPVDETAEAITRLVQSGLEGPAARMEAGQTVTRQAIEAVLELMKEQYREQGEGGSNEH
jgi:AcrR family transcriptional regulator